MALPVTITGLSIDVRYCTRPFISAAGNVYVFGRNVTNTDKLSAFKATDPTSSFSGVGTDITIASGLVIQCVDAYQVGDVIHIATGSGGTENYTIHYSTFNMATDAWAISGETAAAAVTINSSTQAHKAVAIVVRSDGDVIILHNGQEETIVSSQYDRVMYSRRESASWTSGIQVDNGSTKNWYVLGAALGSSDRTHFFINDFAIDDGFQRTLTSANALETFPAAFDTSLNSGGRVQIATSYNSSGTIKVRCLYSDSATSALSVAKLDSADAPTVTVDADITGASNVSNANHVGSLAADGTTLWHAYIQSLGNIFTQSNADGAGWGATSEFYDDAAAVVSLVTNVYTRGSNIILAFVYSTAGAVKYHEKDIGDVVTNDFNMSPTASVTMSGASTATSSINSAATASVTWGGKGLYPAALDSDAAASVTWGGQAVNVQAAAFDSDATAALTWSAASFASAALDADAAATLTWNGHSFAASALDSDATAALTWNGRSFAASALDADATALVEWVGTGDATSAAAFNAAAVASVTWNGEGVYAAALSVAAAASLAAAGTSIATAGWQSSPAATLTWSGEEVSPAGEGAWLGEALADLAMAGGSIAAAAADMTATANAEFRGTNATAVVARDLNGWEISRARVRQEQEELDEEDILILTAALYSYLEQCNGYH